MRNKPGGDLEGAFPLLPGAQSEELLCFQTSLAQVWPSPSQEPVTLTGCAPRSYWSQKGWKPGWCSGAGVAEIT